MNLLLNLQTIKIILTAVFIAAVIWLYKDYQFQKQEVVRLEQNAIELLKKDSLRFAEQTYTKSELKKYLEYNRQDLEQYLKAQKIALRNVQKIITQQLKFKDTTVVETNLQPILDAINNKTPLTVPITDVSECLTIKGSVIFKNDSLSLQITDREFNNTSDIIQHTQRHQWKFLFIKSRFLGKRYTEVTIKDKCGSSQTFIINKK
jgi:hypothetical protein